MSTVPSREEFEESLSLIKARDSGFPEFEDEARALAPTEEAVRFFIESLVSTINEKRDLVNNSIVMKWLSVQDDYQKGYKLAFNKGRNKLAQEEWIEKQIKRLLSKYKPLSMSYFMYRYYDPEYVADGEEEEHLARFNTEESRLGFLRAAALKYTKGQRESWEYFYISAVNNYFIAVSDPEKVIKRKRLKEPDDSHLFDALNSLTQYLNTSSGLSNMTDEEVSNAKDSLESIKSSIESGSMFRFYQRAVIEAGDESQHERELLLTLWHWFTSRSMKPSGKALHDLISIEGIVAVVQHVRSVERLIQKWKDIESRPLS